MKIKRLVASHGKNAAGALTNQLVLTVSGLVTFYVLGRELGVAGYGAYASALAVSHLVVPFAQVGCNHLSVRYFAHSADMSGAWSRLLTTTVVGGVLAAAVLAVAQPVVASGVPRWALTAIALSEISFAGAVGGAVRLTEAAQRPFIGARIRFAAIGARIFALLGFLISELTVTDWALIHLGANVVAALIAVFEMRRGLSAAARVRFTPVSEFTAGLGFATNNLAGSVQNDADKALLAYFDLPRDAGTYAAGFRISRLAAIPLTALVNATYGRFFELGAKSLSTARQFARRMTLLALAANAPVSAALWLLAPVVPMVFGEDFRDAVEVVRWLAILPLVRSCQYFAGNALSGCNLQRLRTTTLAATAALNVALNIVLIPTYTWRGAVAATIVSDVVFAIALWVILETRDGTMRAETPSDVIASQQ